MKRSMYKTFGILGLILTLFAWLTRAPVIGGILSYLLQAVEMYRLMEVLPSLGLVWVAMALWILLFPRIFRKDPSRLQNNLFLLGVLLLFAVLETALMGAFLTGDFDPGDMIAMALAALPLFVINNTVPVDIPEATV